MSKIGKILEYIVHLSQMRGSFMIEELSFKMFFFWIFITGHYTYLYYNILISISVFQVTF